MITAVEALVFIVGVNIGVVGHLLLTRSETLKLREKVGDLELQVRAKTPAEYVAMKQAAAATTGKPKLVAPPARQPWETDPYFSDKVAFENGMVYVVDDEAQTVEEYTPAQWQRLWDGKRVVELT